MFRYSTKPHLVVSLGLLLLPHLAHAAAPEADPFGFANSISLWLAIVTGVIASALVLLNARRISGGVLAQVYTYFGVGMLLVVTGFIAVVLPPWAPPFVIGRVHDVLFIIGYAVMALGARKILTAAGLK